MKPEYDFSNAERGKFFQPNVVLRVPIYLDLDIQKYLDKRAAQACIPLDELVNDLLRQELTVGEPVK